MFSWNFRDLWGGIDGYLRDDLAQVEAAAQTKWFAQHDADGGHGDVTADSVTVVGGTAAGQLRLENDALDRDPGHIVIEQADRSLYTLYVAGGKLYIAAGTSPTGGTVVGTQT